MAGISAVRPPRGSRHLDYLSSDSPYSVTAGFQSSRRRTTNLREGNIFKSDVKETLQQAALINIVAAVNEDSIVNNDNVTKKDLNPPGSALDSLSNTMAVICSLMKPRNRTVSIPRTKQKMFNMPDEIVQKKPVYYKHSEDEEVVRRGSQMNLFDETAGYRVKVCQTPIIAEKSVEKTLRSLPTRSPQLISCFMYDTNASVTPAGNNIRPITRESDTKSWSPIRRLGSVKKSDSRRPHTVAKCDAIDIMDDNKNMTNNHKDPARAVLDDSRKVIPDSNGEIGQYYRTKSLPAVFPVKSTKLTRSTPSPIKPKQNISTVYKSRRSFSKSVQKEVPDSMYSRIMSMPSGYGFEMLTINNGVNQDPDIFSPLTHDSAKQPSPRISFTGIVTQKSNWKQRSISTPATSLLSNDTSITRQASDSTSTKVNLSKSAKDIETNINATELHEAIKQAMSGRSDSVTSLTSNCDTRNALSAKSKRSCLSSKNDPNETEQDKRTAQKHVKFVSRQQSSSSDESGEYHDATKVAKGNVNGGSSVLKASEKLGKSYSAELQAMSTHELLRFKQKFIPANIPTLDIANSHGYISTASGMKLHGATEQKQSNEKTQKAKSDTMESDIDAMSEEALEPYMNDIATDLVESIDAIEAKTKDTATEDSNCAVNNAETVDVKAHNKTKRNKEDNEEGFYKMIKAVDLRSYAGYEHKKLRRTPGSTGGSRNETLKSHFVKIKL